VKFLAAILATLVLALQYPLWISKGSWMRVRDLDQQLAQQRRSNAQLKASNEALDAEVRDLKEGLEMVEEKARFELGMIKPDEIYVQLSPARR